jgi:hypothetical protein
MKPSPELVAFFMLRHSTRTVEDIANYLWRTGREEAALIVLMWGEYRK